MAAQKHNGSMDSWDSESDVKILLRDLQTRTLTVSREKTHRDGACWPGLEPYVNRLDEVYLIPELTAIVILAPDDIIPEQARGIKAKRDDYAIFFENTLDVASGGQRRYELAFYKKGSKLPDGITKETPTRLEFKLLFLRDCVIPPGLSHELAEKLGPPKNLK